MEITQQTADNRGQNHLNQADAWLKLITLPPEVKRFGIYLLLSNFSVSAHRAETDRASAQAVLTYDEMLREKLGSAYKDLSNDSQFKDALSKGKRQ